MASPPLVSVIVPVFNGAAFLAEALESVFAQDYEPLEVIVVDDGSTDDSVAIARSFPEVTCIALARGGVSAARNAGVRASRGEWVAFLDADDRWLPGKLHDQLAATQASPPPNIVFTHQVYLLPDPPPAWYKGPPAGTVQPGYEPSSWLVSRRAFDRVGDFDVTRELGEDHEWLARARDLGLAELVVPHLLVERRIHADNASGRMANRGKLELGILRESVSRKRQAQESEALVSVVIPVFNGARHLAEAIRSVLAQTHPAVELIVVDDGSTDESAAIAEGFAGVRVLPQRNAGMSAARNAGIAISNGQYLAFIDHDDTWSPEKLEVQLRALRGISGPAFALCHLRYRFEGGVPRWFRGTTDGVPVPGHIPSTWLVPRATLERVGLFSTALSHGNDTDWLARARDVGVREVMAPQCLVEYRIHGHNATANTEAIHGDIKAVLRASLQRKRAL